MDRKLPECQETTRRCFRTGAKLVVKLPGKGYVILDLPDIVMTESLVWKSDFQDL